MSSPRQVFYISDRTGLTAENIGEALLNQFGNLSFKRHTHPFVDTPEKARAVVEKVNRVSRKTVSVRLRLSVWLMTKSAGLLKGRMLFRLISLRLFGTVGEGTQYRSNGIRAGASQYRQYEALRCAYGGSQFFFEP